MKLQQLLSYARRAIDDYHMIDDKDRIAVGISGGKDSLALLYAMAALRRFYPKYFEIEAITIDIGFEDFKLDGIAELCQKLKVPYTIVKTEIADIIFQNRKESNPCSLCAKMRKGAFNEKAKALGCNKSAYAHHKDDVMETLLMSLIYEGRLHTFSPVTYLDRMDITLIRPLIYVNECDIIGFRNLYQLPAAINPCPMDGSSKREYTKQLICRIDKENPGARDRLFAAVTSGILAAWRKPDM